nr:PREDICTED: type IV inositol polyphosphate 5-phosphatase 3-like isoform X2 [Daucus carota subsp. sativus]
MYKNQHELGMVARKLLNIRDKGKSNYSADADDFNYAEFDTEVFEFAGQSKFQDSQDEEVVVDPKANLEALPRLRRRNSETFRTEYITAREVRIFAGTWNVACQLPTDDLNIEEWLDINEAADIYVIGLQEIISLNAGNIFGVEDIRPIPKWERLIRETLNKIQPVKMKGKCYSDPPSPSKFEQSEDFSPTGDEASVESDGDEQEEIFMSKKESDFKNNYQVIRRDELLPTAGANLSILLDEQLSTHFYAPKTSKAFGDRVKKRVSKKEIVGLSWAEPPLDLLAHCNIDRTTSLTNSKSFKAFNSINFLKSSMNDDTSPKGQPPDTAASTSKVDLEPLVNWKRRSHYVRIVSKQMVGVFITIWVRRSLRRHIQNVNVSTVGVGAMGYMGNKGSISVSMSIYQTLFCFICTHLSAGEKKVDAIRRNADVRAIHSRTHFNSFTTIPLPKSIYDHERIIWLGDLNYRINLPYNETRKLISTSDWTKLIEHDQLVQEFKKGGTFDGWSEGTLNFPPTYKYELNSDKYRGEDSKEGRRTPAWCDRVISFGKGIKLISYGRTELRLSDHQPVAASYMVEVEVFCPKRLQKALKYTGAEIEYELNLLDYELGKI